MTTSAERFREYRGPTILSRGYRPFFLLGPLWAAIAMIWWVVALTTGAAPPSRLAPLDWHAHELLFGYLPAVVCGFLLTAIPNWTKRLPVTGSWLAALALLWIAGRAAVAMSLYLPLGAAAAVDCAFLAVVALLVSREIVAGRNWRNGPVLGLVGLLLAGNVVFHWEAWGLGFAANGAGSRLGAAASVLMILLIGGRITPSFTRNWLAGRQAARLPASFGAFDSVALALGLAALAVWVAAPWSTAAAWLSLAAGGAHLVRLARWAGERTLAEPLVMILHLGYAFAPIGFLLLGLSILAPADVPRVAALHAWLAGAVGVTTLGVMTRASLGHSGRALTASPATVAIYGAALASALSRIAAAFLPSELWLLHLSAAGWVAAFAGFAIVYLPILAAPRLEDR